MIDIPEFNFDRDEWVEDKKLVGTKISELILADLKRKIESADLKPGLGALLIGDDPASEIYVNSKRKKASLLGFHSEIKKFPKGTPPREVLIQVQKWNRDDNIHGILVQLPLPDGMPTRQILQSVVPEKDVDGFHFQNMGRLFANEPGTLPCTPLGIAVILNQLRENLAGKKAVVVGRSNIVGKPTAQILLNYFHCTVTLCHSKTPDVSHHVKEADILVAALGKRGIIHPDDIKDNSIIIDVGIHRIQGKLYGDIDHWEVLEKVKYVTPVPGGVGPMTIAMLLHNTYQNSLG